MANPHSYDLVLYGATGFTGGLVADYLVQKQDESFRWAIAGRSAEKVRQVKQEHGLPETVGVLTAESGDHASLLAMARQTRVVLSTVGPYVQHGEPLVRACAEAGTHYADITGEPAFVNTIIQRYDEEARRKKIRIVNCCGFDSIPHDLGVYMVVQELPDDATVTVEGFVSGSGGLSGGTWHSAIEAIANMRKRESFKPWKQENDGRTVGSANPRIHYAEEVKGWVVPFPTVDPQVILRSARALPVYGREFRYAHYGRLGSLPRLIGTLGGVAGVAALAQFAPTKQWLLNRRQPGEGPSAERRANGKFRVAVVGRANGQTVKGDVRGGDPGYGETSKMAAESALCLALDELPERYGVLTTAQAMGDALLARLRRAGIVFAIQSQITETSE